MSAKASTASSLITLPKGGGAIKGLGEKFAPEINTGTGNFSIPLTLPAGRNGFQPSVGLNYSTGNGNGPFGLGWSLGTPSVSRLTSRGVPQYLPISGSNNDDVFVLLGAEDLVPVAQSESKTRYRPRTEGLFAQIDFVHTDATSHWEVRSKDGLVSLYGTPNQRGRDPAVVADPSSAHARVFSWLLTSTRDPFDNLIRYEYSRDPGIAQGSTTEFDQLYIHRILYADFGSPDAPNFLLSVMFEYEDRPDEHSSFRSGFEIRTRRRCRSVFIQSHPAPGRSIPIRRYDFAYEQDLANGMSMLRRVSVIGFDEQGRLAAEMPPLEFSYSTFDVQRRRLVPVSGADLPPVSLASPSLELIDVTGNGLPDIVELAGTVRYWRNLGRGHFDRPKSFTNSPASWRLADNSVQILDANGDGRADLLVTTPEDSGYYPLDFKANFSNKSFQRYRQAPSFSLEDPEVKLIDLTGDGISDVLRSGTSFECYFNDRVDGWTPSRTMRIPRRRLEEFPDVSFSDPRVKLADLNGDGLQDIVLLHENRVDYWANIGRGRWSRRRTMRLSPGLPHGFDPARVLLGDIDGDGLADLVYVGDREVTFWINHSGRSWSAPQTARGTPGVNTMVSVRLTDLLGEGVSGILWTRDSDGSGRPQHHFLDFTGGKKPYLLNRFTNNLGATTTVDYITSTHFYLEDERKAETRWRTTLPFPVHVVRSVTVADAISGGTLTTEYRYHHGYWDGVEREFRGFGMVEQRDTELFDTFSDGTQASSGRAVDRLPSQTAYSPPVLTRTWFHQGPFDPAGDEHWLAGDQLTGRWSRHGVLLPATDLVAFLARLPAADRRDAVRALRGSRLRSETYALDGSPLEDRPYTVTEHSYALREVDPSPTPGSRQRIFFPHSVGECSTQWERGNDPQTKYSFLSGYDDVGQARRKVDIACPRGWSSLTDRPAASYLATQSLTAFARPLDSAVYIRDRVCSSRSFEILKSAGKTIEELIDISETSAEARLIAESRSFYDSHDRADADYGAFSGLEFGRLGRYGALVRTEALIMTAEQLVAAYGGEMPSYIGASGPRPVPGGYPAVFIERLESTDGYVYRQASPENSAGYFAVAERKRYDFHRHGGKGRGLVLASRDALGRTTEIKYDDYGLLPVEVTGPTGLTTKAEYDYRVFMPKRVIDANGSVTEQEYSPLGLATSTWLRGKPSAPGADRRNAGDRQLPSVQMEYDLRAFVRSRQPVSVRAVQRVFHDSDPDDTGETIETREYSDGFGRLLQTRTQGETHRFGDPDFGSGGLILPASQSAALPNEVSAVETADAQSPNVVVSGWHRYDNKGRVIQKYEPFFDVGWDYRPQQDSKLGRCVTMQYDPRGQAIRKTYPDGSEQIVIYGIPRNLAEPPRSAADTKRFAPTPWEVYTYDQNDNAGRTHAAAGAIAAPAHHHNTPSNIEIDALGRTVRAVARHRAPAADASIEEHITRSTYDIRGNLLGIRDALGRLAFTYTYDLANRVLASDGIDAGAKWSVYDAAGNVVEHGDAKGARTLHAYDALDRPTHVWARDDASDALTLRERYRYDSDPAAPALSADRNLLGKLFSHHDEAGLAIAAEYDFKGNVIRASRQALSDAFMLRDFRRAMASGDWTLRPPRIDWSTEQVDALAGSPVHVTLSSFDALGRVKWSEYPKAANGERYRLRPRYNRAGALQGVALIGPLDASGSGAAQDFVRHIAYDAKGQRTLIAYGNGLITRYAYDPATFRLVRLRTDRYEPGTASVLSFKPSGPPLQDIAYRHDLTGNIVEMCDLTPGCGVAANPEAASLNHGIAQQLVQGDALVRRFEYDPLYRLTMATGREASNIASPRPWTDYDRHGYGSGRHGTPDQDNAPRLTAIYRESYDYDAAGNILTMTHERLVPSAGGAGRKVRWSRHFGMDGRTPETWRGEIAGHIAGEWTAPPSNRLTHVENGEVPGRPQTHFYDASGNMVRENNERYFEWDHADRMKAFRNQVGASRPTTYALYLYDAAGQRVKKLVVEGTGYRTTTYVGAAFEHHAEHARLNGVAAVAENCSLHIMDGTRRIAIVRVGSAFGGDGRADHAVQFHLSDHLGSSSLVVAADGAWINREEYFPYGETSFGGSPKRHYRFSGKERCSESSLYYFGARYYSAHTTKWTSADPVLSDNYSNLFIFVKCNPIRNGEVDGNDFADFVDGAIDGAIQGFVIGAGVGVVLTLAPAALPLVLLAGAVGLALTAGTTLRTAHDHFTGAIEPSVAHRRYGEVVGGLLGGAGGARAGGALGTRITNFLESAPGEGLLVPATSAGNASVRAPFGRSNVRFKSSEGLGDGPVTGGSSSGGVSPGAPKATWFKKLIEKHNGAEARIVAELKKLGIRAESGGGRTIKDAQGNSIEGTAGTKTTRKPDVAAQTLDGNSVTKNTGIEVKGSLSEATQLKAANQLKNEASFEGSGYFSNIPWTTGQGSGVAYTPYGVLSVQPAACMPN